MYKTASRFMNRRCVKIKVEGGYQKIRSNPSLNYGYVGDEIDKAQERRLFYKGLHNKELRNQKPRHKQPTELTDRQFAEIERRCEQVKRGRKRRIKRKRK